MYQLFRALAYIHSLGVCHRGWFSQRCRVLLVFFPRFFFIMFEVVVTTSHCILSSLDFCLSEVLWIHQQRFKHFCCSLSLVLKIGHLKKTAFGTRFIRCLLIERRSPRKFFQMYCLLLGVFFFFDLSFTCAGFRFQLM